MAEVVSEDVMDWARDLIALEKLLAGEPLTDPPIDKQAILLQFAPPESRQPLMNDAFDSINDIVRFSPTNRAALQSSSG